MGGWAGCIGGQPCIDDPLTVASCLLFFQHATPQHVRIDCVVLLSTACLPGHLWCRHAFAFPGVCSFPSFCRATHMRHMRGPVQAGKTSQCARCVQVYWAMVSVQDDRFGDL